MPRKLKFPRFDYDAPRKPWLAAGAWTFVYERVDGDRFTPDDMGPYVISKEALAELKDTGATKWRPPGEPKDIKLKKSHIDILRLMVGDYEDSFSTLCAKGGGWTVFVHTKAEAPIVIAWSKGEGAEKTGARLEEINPSC